VLFSEPKIPQSTRKLSIATLRSRFQCSSASRKFLNGYNEQLYSVVSWRFSALQRAENSSILDASERKIAFPRFSALQRAENSSISTQSEMRETSSAFQCSSASRKFLNVSRRQRTEDCVPAFQCSSASRKFLNGCRYPAQAPGREGFSALQRAENSSIPTLAPASIHISDRDDHASSFLSLPGASP